VRTQLTPATRSGPRRLLACADLLEREAAAREQRKQEEEARRTLEERLARLRQEGLARQQEEEERRARELFEQAARAATPEPDLTAPSILDEVTELDKTLKVKWNPGEHPYTEKTLQAALTRFGPVDSLVLSAKRPGTAVVAFESIVDAVRPSELVPAQKPAQPMH